jgi:predicted  nucleic acid-binding Zn-ribbon protein
MSSVAPDLAKPGVTRAEAVKAARATATETAAETATVATTANPVKTRAEAVKAARATAAAAATEAETTVNPVKARAEAVKAARATATETVAETETATVATTVKPGDARAEAVKTARAATVATTVKPGKTKTMAATVVKKKKNKENNSESVSSTSVNMGQEKPHLRTVDLPSANFNNNNSNNNSTVPESERNEEDRTLDNFEPNDPKAGQEPEPALNIPITSKADSTMFLLLRVGNDTTSEYIELRKQPIASMGSFNTHSIGSVKEFENLYGIKSSEGYKAMQRAFGVSKYGKTAPFIDYIHVKKCKFIGFDLVKEGLNNRIRTLGESVTMQNASMNRSRNSHFLEWLKEQVKLMDIIKKECPSVPITATGTTTSSIAVGTNVTTGVGCPCLEDLSILRDLIYLVVTIEGSSRPEVKKQLESIPISKILNIAVKPAEKKTIILQAIEALQKISSANNDVKKEELQPVLRTIWTALTKEVVTRDVTQQEILDRIGLLISKVHDLESSKVNAAAISSELDDSRKRLKALQELLGKVDSEEVSPNSEEVKQLKARVEELSKVNPVKHNNSEEVKQLRAHIQELTEEVRILEAKMATAVTDVNRRQNDVQQSLGSEEEKRLKARVTELETNVTTLRTNRDKAVADVTKAREALAETEKELVILREKHEAESKENASKKERISKELAAARVHLQELEEKISLAKEDDEAHREVIENARKNVERLKLELLKIEGPDNSKTNSLEEQIVKLKEELSKEKELKVSKEPAKINHKDLDVLKEQVQGLEASIKAAIEKNNTATKERLNTLLGFLVIHDDMRVRAMQYWEAGNDSQRSEITSELSGEVCEFFKYFSSLINLQLDKINNTLVSDNIKADIFAMFKSVPGFDSKLLRKELGEMFQEIFIHIGTKTEINEFSLEGSYPELYKVISGIGNLGESLSISEDDLGKFLYDIAGTGFLSEIGVNAKNNEIKLKFINTLNDTSQSIFLTLLGVKLIQLLKESLDEKYDDLTKRCSV